MFTLKIMAADAAIDRSLTTRMPAPAFLRGGRSGVGAMIAAENARASRHAFSLLDFAVARRMLTVQFGHELSSFPCFDFGQGSIAEI